MPGRRSRSNKRDYKLDPLALNLSAQMEGGLATLTEFLGYFSKRIDAAGLRPWGRVGKKHLNAAVEELTQNGGFDRLHYCDKCRESFLMSTDATAISQFLLYFRDKIDWGDFCRCKRCGGVVEVAENEL